MVRVTWGVIKPHPFLDMHNWHFLTCKMCFKKSSWNFPGGTGDKNPPANAGDTGSTPDIGRTHTPQSN